MSKEKIDGRYDYFAFVSYTEENTEKAQDLKKKLTHYRFPKDVREERSDLPSWIRPVFEWKTDTSGGDLRGKDSQINNALFNSKYLIVICSPHAVKSEPVNGEIQDFIKWGREKYIIPFIIDGQPHAENPEEECFPPALFELEGDRERKGIFIDNINEDYAVNSVVSTMFNIKVNDLWKPYEREQRRRMNFILGGVILAALIGFSAGVYFYLLNKENEILREIRDEQLSHIKEDSIKLQKRLFQIQQDSAIIQKHLFRIQQDSARIAEKSDSLILLTENLLAERNGMLMAQSRAMAHKSLEIPYSADVLSSVYLALQSLPVNLNTANRPYTSEAEYALRQSLRILLDEGFKCHYTIRENPVYDIAINPKKKLLVYKTLDELWLYDIMSGKRFLLDGSQNCSDVSFSPDGKYIISSVLSTDENRGGIRIWNSDNMQLMLKKIYDEYLVSPNICPNGKYFVASSDRWYGKSSSSSFSIFDLEGNIVTTKKISGFSRGAYYSPSGKSIGVCSDSIIYLYDVEKSLLQELDHQNNNRFYGLNWGSSDDRLLVLGKNGVYVYNVKEMRHLYDVSIGEDINSALFSENGRELYVFSTKKMVIFDSQSGERIQEYPILKYSSGFLGYNPILQAGNEFITSGSDGIQFWKLSRNNLNKDSIDLRIKNPTTFFFNEPQNLVSVVDRDTISGLLFNRVLFTKNGEEIFCLKCNYGYYGKGLFTKDNRYYVTEKDSILFLVDIESDSLYTKKQEGYIRYTEIHPNKNQVACLSGDGSLIFISLENGVFDEIQRLDFDRFVVRFKYSHDGKNLIVLFQNSMEIYDIRTGKELKSINVSVEKGAEVVLSPNGVYALVVWGYGNIQLWNIKNSKCVWSIKTNDHISYSEFSHNGRYFLCNTYQGKCKIFNTLEGGLIDVIENSYSDNAHFGVNDSEIITSNGKGHIIYNHFPQLEEILEELKIIREKIHLTDEEQKNYYMK